MKYYILKKQGKYVKELIDYKAEIVLTDKQKEAKRFYHKLLAQEYLFLFKEQVQGKIDIDSEIKPDQRNILGQPLVSCIHSLKESLKSVNKIKIVKVNSKKLTDVEQFLQNTTKDLSVEEKSRYLKELSILIRRQELRDELKALTDYDGWYLSSSVGELTNNELANSMLKKDKDSAIAKDALENIIKILNSTSLKDLLLNKEENNNLLEVLKGFPSALAAVKEELLKSELEEKSRVKIKYHNGHYLKDIDNEHFFVQEEQKPQNFKPFSGLAPEIPEYLNSLEKELPVDEFEALMKYLKLAKLK